MRPSRLRRANLLLLAMLLGGGGSGLPLLDAALHHLGGMRRPADQLHGCEPGSTHAERCTLGAALPVLARAGRQHQVPPSALFFVTADAGLGATRPALALRPSPALPRAPPLSPA